MRKLLIGVSRKIEYSIRNDFFAHLQKLDSTFFENNRTGSIMALMSNDLDAVRNFLGPGLLNLFSTVFVFISTVTIMFLISVKLTLYSLIAIPLLPLIVSRLSAMLYYRFKISQEHYSLLSARTQESIAGIKVIKSFTRQNYETDNFAELNSQYINKNMELAKVRSFFWPAMILIGGIGSLLVLTVGGMQVIQGQLTLGQFVQFSAYIITLTWPLISLGWVINLVQRGEVSMGRLNSVLNLSPTISVPQKPVNIDHYKGDIVFNNVHFFYPEVKSYDIGFLENKTGKTKSYIKKFLELISKYFLKTEDQKNGPEFSYKDADLTNARIENKQSKKDSNYTETGINKSLKKPEWVIKKINFTIKAGMSAGIVGFTGSGKSTIVNLLPRLYDPQQGVITIGGHDIKNISPAALRSHIAYVTQDAFIFSKTIKENILFGKEQFLQFSEANNPDGKEIDGKIIRASKIAHLHEDVMKFPDGYDTLIGERGVTLSGGQKQRLAIARTIIADPEILILDDSFSNIDTATEELILQDLKIHTSQLTTIIVSHRISTIKDSDIIIVMDEGQISETGTHSQLLKKCGIYRKLYYRQQLSDELKEEL
ncbi:MAG: ABC transporter ATP-binding protein [Actinobacteria bacterium]|nr:ABC transporter ATP-binding protein [Actinomycetota bacterium]